MSSVKEGVSKEEMPQEDVPGGGAINFDADELLAEGLEVIGDEKELAPLSEMLREFDEAMMEVEDPHVEASVDRAAERLARLTTASGSERNEVRPQRERRERRTTGTRIPKRRGRRGGRRTQYGPRSKPIFRARTAVSGNEGIVRASGVLIAPRPPARVGSQSRRHERPQTQRTGDLESGEIRREGLVDSLHPSPCELRAQELEREDRIIRGGPLRSEEIPSALRLRALCMPICRERLPHETITRMPESARRVEEHRILTGQVKDPPPQKRTSKAYLTWMNAKYEPGKTTGVAGPLSLRQLVDVFEGQPPPNTYWSLMRSGNEDRYFILTGFVSFIVSTEFLVVACGSEVSVVPWYELQKNGELPEEQTFSGWCVPGLGALSMCGPFYLDLRLGSVVKTVEFYASKEISTPVLGRNCILSHGMSFHEETLNFKVSSGETLVAVVVPRDTAKKHTVSPPVSEIFRKH